MRNFHDNEHANNRLSRCYVMVKKNAKWVLDKIESATKNMIHTVTGNAYPIDSDKIEYMFSKFGYCNTENQAAYVTRSSKRGWKVGLTGDNIKVEFLYPRQMRMEDQPELSDMLPFLFDPKYPTALEAIHSVSLGERAAVAISRKFCLGLHDKTTDIVLYYQNLPVGHFCKKEVAIILGGVNKHLLESLEEILDGQIGVLI